MSSARLSQSSGTAPRRRNGRAQACEPCRKRKVACDHRLPICSRCKSAEIGSSCVYSPQNPNQSQKRKITSIASPQPVVQPEPRDGGTTVQPLTPLINHQGFLGVTSFKYAMDEAQSRMASLLPPEATLDEPNAASSHPSRSPLMANEKLYDTAMRALRGIPERTLAYNLFKAYVNPNDAWCRLAVHQLHSSFWSAFGVYLDGERSTMSLLQLATKLCDNSSKPLHEDYTDPKEWLDSFCGHNMRWEGLGVLFTYWAHGASAIRQSPEHENPMYSSCSSYIFRYKDCAWDIIDLTRNTASANTLLLYLLCRQSNLESIIWGDDSEYKQEIVTLPLLLGKTLTFSFRPSAPEAGW